MAYYTTTLYCDTTRLLGARVAQSVQVGNLQTHCATIQYYYTTIYYYILLYCYTAILLYCYTAILLYYSTVLQYFNTSIQQYYILRYYAYYEYYEYYDTTILLDY